MIGGGEHQWGSAMILSKISQDMAIFEYCFLKMEQIIMTFCDELYCHLNIKDISRGQKLMGDTIIGLIQ